MQIVARNDPQVELDSTSTSLQQQLLRASFQGKLHLVCRS